jgi:hypothetical protein
MALAKQLWPWRWSLLKKPSPLSGEEKQAMTALESEEEGFHYRTLFKSQLKHRKLQAWHGPRSTDAPAGAVPAGTN